MTLRSTVWPLSIALVLALALGVSTSLSGCGDDDEPVVEGSLEDTSSSDAKSLTVDTNFAEPCIGIKPDPAAEVYNDQCDGIDECQQMEKQAGSCWCAYCGPKGAKIECLQVHCQTPGQ